MHAHNIFTKFCKGGIIGLLILLGFVFAIFEAVKSMNTLYLLFIFVFILSGLTESFLLLNTGVLFFAFFNTILF